MAMIGIKINKTILDWKNFTKKKKKGEIWFRR